MGRGSRRGFTLPELMATVAVIAMIVAVLAPYFQRVFTVQRKVQCANNLEKLGQAFGTRSSDEAEGPLAASGWPGALAPYVAYAQEVFICPEDDAKGLKPEPMKPVFIEVFTGQVNDQSVHMWDLYIDQAGQIPWAWKLSGTQYKHYLAVGSGERIYCPYIAIYERTGYVPDDDLDTWYFVFEDQGFRTGSSAGGDRDFYDINLKIHYTDTDAQFSTLYLEGATGYNFNLCYMDPDRKVLIADMKNAGRNATASLPYCRAKSSYGMNSMSRKLTPGRDKLLLLDYLYPVAYGSIYSQSVQRTEHLKYWEGDPKDPRDLPKFARHFGRCNVLSANGSVRLMSPGRINPGDPDACRRYWDP